MSGGTRILEAEGDYRAKATRAVALAVLMLMLPLTLYALLRGNYVAGFGGAYINTILVINTVLIAHGRNHEPMTLYALIPGGIVCMALSYTVDGNLASVWCFPSILACYCMLSRRKAIVANTMIMSVAVPMMWLTLDPVDAARLSASLLCVSLFANILVREIDAQQLRLRYQLNHDPLTGLLNRTSLKAQLQAAISAYKDSSIPATLIAIDLDHFKSVNDRFGHDGGDIVLCEVARLLKEHVAHDGTAFRLGGEEFLILLTDNGKATAYNRAESLRATIADTAILQSHPISASIGTANLHITDDEKSWTRRSDNRLYAAKRNGRNCVVSDGEIDLEPLPLSRDDFSANESGNEGTTKRNSATALNY